MYAIEVHAELCAAHSIRIAGTPEPLHGHNWRITAALEGTTLDDDGLLCDFHTVEATLREIIAPFHNNTLNALPPFDRLNPTAEHLARHLADELSRLLGDALAPHARIARVSVTEAPGCVATYSPPHANPS